MMPSLAMPTLMAALMAFGLTACSEEPQQAPPTAATATARPATAPQAATPMTEPRQRGKGGGRGAGGGCGGGGQESTLQLMRGQEMVWDKPAEEITGLPGAISIEFGRHQGDPGLPLSALLTGDGGGRMVEVVPCSGEPIRLMVGEFADQPNRYVIVRTPRGMLKLVDYSNPNSGGVTMAKNLHAVRLRALGHEGPRQQAADSEAGP